MGKTISPPGKKNSHLFLPALLTGIVVFTALLYMRSLHGEFLDYDDMDNVVNNGLISQFSPGHLVQLFSRAYLYMYAPLTFVTYATDFLVYGLDPSGFKLTNLLIHLFNVTLLFLLSRQLFKNTTTAALLVILFAIHPLNVDSVSWISARSNLLATLFFFLALLLYLQYLEKKRITWLVMVTISFLLSLLSKSSGIMLPLTLLLVDYLVDRKFNWKVIVEKSPVFILSLVFGLIAVYFRSDSGNPQSFMEYNIFDRFLMICYTLTGYLIKSILPFQLSAIYAYPVKTGIFLPFLYYLTPFILAGVIFLVSRLKKRRREVVFGLGFFLINVLLTQVVLLEDSFMANRYGYLPCVGLFFIISAGFDHFMKGSRKMQNISMLVISSVLLFFSVVTFQRSQVWKNTLTLFNDAVERSPGSAFAWNNRGIARYSGNDLEGALNDYNRAITLFPGYSGAYYNRGIICYSMREFTRANTDYSTAIDLNPKFASCYAARGILEMDILQNDSLAMEDYNKAITINPEMAQAYYNRGILWLRMKNIQLACEDFHQVRRLGYTRADDLIRQFCE
jgi:protein O-mannosyl-transferase